jgi:hypothetical protein
MPQKSNAQEWDPKQGAATPTPPDSKEERKMSDGDEDLEDEEDFDDSEETDEDVDELDEE